MNTITLEEYTELLKKYEELRQDKIRILNKYYVEKDDLKQEIERLNSIINEVRERLIKPSKFIERTERLKLLEILKDSDKE